MVAISMVFTFRVPVGTIKSTLLTTLILNNCSQICPCCTCSLLKTENLHQKESTTVPCTRCRVEEERYQRQAILPISWCSCSCRQSKSRTSGFEQEWLPSSHWDIDPISSINLTIELMNIYLCYSSIQELLSYSTHIIHINSAELSNIIHHLKTHTISLF